MSRIPIIALILLAACHAPETQRPPDANARPDTALARLFENYFQRQLLHNPVSATFIGDNRYNDRFENDESDAWLKTSEQESRAYLDTLQHVRQGTLNAEDALSCDVLAYSLRISLEGVRFHADYLPFDQRGGWPLQFAQLGSGVAQPFRTATDYENWRKRVAGFSLWVDTAIAKMKKGIDSGIVLPRALVVKMIPELTELAAGTPEKSVFFKPVQPVSDSVPAEDRAKIVAVYTTMIRDTILPAYRRLADFLQKEYLPHARTTSGYGSLPNGAAWYAWLVKAQTTTEKTPDEIYRTGLSEVARIRGQMDSIREAVGFKGTLPALFDWIKHDKRFMPYKTPQQVLDAFESIHRRIVPYVAKAFRDTPRTRFEIRQTESFRAASASIEYQAGTPDGKRPGIFYVPVLDATQFNITSGMESTFLHEAIPGHHFQISLAQEDTMMPAFRRFMDNNAYAEGWALYCESLGKSLGLYTDPYQYLGALGDEMLRAVRLVVDVGIHARGMTREAAIRYMLDNCPISPQLAEAEVERYMANPGQALGYKIGALKIRELRDRAQAKLGPRFDLAEFHHQVLKDGAVPLDILEEKIDRWIGQQAVSRAGDSAENP